MYNSTLVVLSGIILTQSVVVASFWLYKRIKCIRIVAYLAVAAIVLNIVNGVILSVAQRTGITEANRLYAVLAVFTPLSLGSTKLALLFLYRRISPSKRPWILWLLIGIVGAWTASFFFLYLFCCGTCFFRVEIGIGRCLDLKLLSLVEAILNLVIDVLLPIFPIRLIRTLQSPPKILIPVFLGCCSFAFISSFLRAIFLSLAILNIGPSWFHNLDFISLWKYVNVGLTLTGFCMIQLVVEIVERLKVVNKRLAREIHGRLERAKGPEQLQEV